MSENRDLIFTEYFRALEPEGQSPNAELFQVFWDRLRRVLVAEMKKRSLWATKPGYLGIQGAERWTEAALSELQVDVYTFMLERLPGIRAQLRIKPNVEGLIFRNLHNYLYDTQKRYDPVGFRAFEMTRLAVRQLIQAGRLQVLEGDSGVRNNTLVAFTGAAESLVKIDSEVIEAAVRGWNDHLLPELVTARGKKKDQVAERLARAISGLVEDGLVEDGAFFFADLVNPIKNDVRSRWTGLWSHGEGETALEGEDDGVVAVVLQVPPSTQALERDAFDKLLVCMAETLDQASAPERTRRYLDRLWVFVRDHAASDDDKPPSQRHLAQILSIPRDRLPALQGTLGAWIDACRESRTGHFRKSEVKG